MSAETAPRAVPSPGVGKRIIQAIAVALTIVAGGFLLFVPTYAIETVDSSGNRIAREASILAAMGPWAIGLALIPVALALVPLLMSAFRWQMVSVLATVCLGAWIVAGIWTIGGFYVPAFLCLLTSVFLPPRSGST